METFKFRVISFIKTIPKGKVVSYGQVAAYAGSPRAARQVGGILSRLNDTTIPWWRVINNAGIISIKGNGFISKDIQKNLLEKEGVMVSEEFTLDIEEYRFRK